MIPGFTEYREEAVNAGSLGTVVSGSGSAMVSICLRDNRDRVLHALTKISAPGVMAADFTNKGIIYVD
jgi:homoserine kinase